ncbi:MAG: hypothetical protein ACTIMP_11895, partial [Lactiplantibacillus plantarum]
VESAVAMTAGIPSKLNNMVAVSTVFFMMDRSFLVVRACGDQQMFGNDNQLLARRLSCVYRCYKASIIY